MKFLKKLWSLLFGKKEQAPTASVGYTADLVVDESQLEPIVEPVKGTAIVEVPEVVAEEIAEAAVKPKKKKPAKKK